MADETRDGDNPTTETEPTENTDFDTSGIEDIGNKSVDATQKVGGLDTGLGNVKARLEEIQQIVPQALGQSFGSTLEKVGKSSENLFGGVAPSAVKAKESSEKAFAFMEGRFDKILTKFQGKNIFDDMSSVGNNIGDAMGEIENMAESAMKKLDKSLSGGGDRLSSAVGKSIGPASVLLGQSLMKGGVQAIDNLTGVFSKLQRPLMDVEKQALKMSLGMGKSFSDASGNVSSFRDGLVSAVVDTKTSLEDVRKVQESFKDAFDAGEVMVNLAGLSKASSQLAADVNLTNTALLVSAATGMDNAKVAEMMSVAHTELGADLNQSVTMLGDIATAADKSGLSFGRVSKAVMESADKLKLWGGTISSVTPLYKAFADSLDEGRKGLAPQLVEQFVGGLSEMRFEMKALAGITAGGGVGGAGGRGAIGAGLEMEALMEKGPEGMAEMSDKLVDTLKRFSGGEVVTRQEAIENPALERNFMVQRQLLKQMLNVDDKTANQMMGALKDIDKNGLKVGGDSEKKIGELMAQGKSVQDRTVDVLQEQTQLLDASIQSSGSAIIEQLSNLASAFGKNIPSAIRKAQRQAVKSGTMTIKDVAKTSREMAGKQTTKAVEQKLGVDKRDKRGRADVAAGLETAQGFSKEIMSGIMSAAKQKGTDMLTGTARESKDLTVAQRKDIKQGKIDPKAIEQDISDAIIKVNERMLKMLGGRKEADLGTKERAEFEGLKQLEGNLIGMRRASTVDVGRLPLTKEDKQKTQQEDRRISEKGDKDIVKGFENVFAKMRTAQKSGAQFDYKRAITAEGDLTKQIQDMTPKQARRARQAVKEQYADQGKDVQQTMVKAFDRIRKFETVTAAFADLKLDDLVKTPQVEDPTIQNLPETEEALAQALEMPGDKTTTDAINKQTDALVSASKETKDAIDKSGEKTKAAVEKETEKAPSALEPAQGGQVIAEHLTDQQPTDTIAKDKIGTETLEEPPLALDLPEGTEPKPIAVGRQAEGFGGLALPDVTAEAVDAAPLPDKIVEPKQTTEEARNIMSGRAGERAERVAAEQAAFEADMGGMFADREPIAPKLAPAPEEIGGPASNAGWGATDVIDALNNVGGGQIVSQEEAAGNEELQKVFDEQQQLLKDMTGTDDKGAADLMSSLKDISEKDTEAQDRLSETMETASRDEQEKQDPVEQARQMVDRATTEQPELVAPVDQAAKQTQEVKEKRTTEEKETVEKRKLMLDIELNTKVDGETVTITIDEEKLNESIRAYINDQTKG